MDGLGDGRLHQVDVAHNQGDEQGLQVFVEGAVAQVSCGEEEQVSRRGIIQSDHLTALQRWVEETFLYI